MAEDESDRRAAERHAVYIGAEIDVGNGPVRSAITRDGSATGLLLLTRAKVEIGQVVKINVFLSEGESRTLSARVVRQDPLDAEENALWRQKVAVEMSEADPDLAAKLADLARHQAATYGSG
jgi:hypothetical protein